MATLDLITKEDLQEFKTELFSMLEKIGIGAEEKKYNEWLKSSEVRKLMQFSKISSKTTYHKCMQDLVYLGYILYEPSFDTYQASRITILKAS